ncbi:MAG: gamma-glutamyl-gamma-aminobutyrate hydrolase family protein [Bacillota bacterium]
MWPAYLNKPAPELDDVSAIIITGSHSMVTDQDDWSMALCAWLRSHRSKCIPTLGICYGHQLISQAFGGQVDYYPQGKELGTVSIQLTEAGISDPLLGVLPRSFLGHVAHSQTVLQLPPGARILAKNDFEQHHAFVLDDCIWGVQFQPEFNAGITEAYTHTLGTGTLC